MDIDPRGPRFVYRRLIGRGSGRPPLDTCLGCQVYLFIQRNPRVWPSA